MKTAKKRKRTFRPAILLERLPMERGETVHMVLFAAGMLCIVAENHEEGDDEDEDDKFLLSKPFPESQSKLQLHFHEEKQNEAIRN